ncbi:threonine-phosphate decarboxylase [Bacillus canaveralius]|nr:threonine-phosphate decarboxylase [Bacillus canaveralius]
MNMPLHGSNPHSLYKTLNIDLPRQICDFSANINPFGPPPALKEKWNEMFTKIIDYPDPKGAQLVSLLAAQDDLAENSILLGNGGAELIALIGRWLAGKRILIIEPSFCEYETACRASGCTIIHHFLEEGNWDLHVEHVLHKLNWADAVFICNPNNPTGQSFSRTAIQGIVEESFKMNTFVIIDEAFYHFLEDEASFVSFVKDFPNLLILRSLTKIYSIPGLRLGYLIADHELIRKVSLFQPHWSVNSVALAAGVECLNSGPFLTDSRKYIEAERRRLFHFYKESGYRFSDSCVNFYLLQDPFLNDQLSLLKFLLEQGIAARHTYNFKGLHGRWLRLAVKRTGDNDRLMEVLEEWRQVQSSL